MVTVTGCNLPEMGKAKSEEEKKVTVCTRILPSEHDALMKACAADDRTPAYVLAKALREFLERHKQKRK